MRSYRGGVASYKTSANRKDVLECELRWLFEEGYRITRVEQFRTKHIKVLVDHWIEERLAPGTIQNKLSIFRTFCHWIEKPNVCHEADAYIASRPDHQARIKREYVAKTDTGWPVEHDFETILLKILGDDPHVAIQIALMAVFGLRPREAALLKPRQADLGENLHVILGTKGGRPRIVPIENETQRQVLDKAKTMTTTPNGSLIPEKYSYKSWRSRFYYICRKHGMQKIEGTHPYALRHDFIQTLYQILTGMPAPVKRASNAEDSEQTQPLSDNEGRLVVAERAGHSRIQITNCYLGSRRSVKQDTKPPSK